MKCFYVRAFYPSYKFYKYHILKILPQPVLLIWRCLGRGVKKGAKAPLGRVFFISIFRFRNLIAHIFIIGRETNIILSFVITY